MKDISSNLKRIQELRQIRRTELIVKEFQNISWASLARYDWADNEVEGLGNARTIILEHNAHVFRLDYYEMNEIMTLIALPDVKTWFNGLPLHEVKAMIEELGIAQYETAHNDFYFYDKEQKMAYETQSLKERNLSQDEIVKYLKNSYLLDDATLESVMSK